MTVDPFENLFRPEAVSAARRRLGYPVRPVSIAPWLIIAFLGALIVLAVGFASVAQYARRETVQGMVSTSDGTARITSIRAGTVLALHQREGARVTRGAPLITISTDIGGVGGEGAAEIRQRASEAETLALATQVSAQQNELASRQRDLVVRREGLEEEISHLEADLATQQERVRLEDANVQAARSLHERQLMSAVVLRSREEALLAARQGVSAIQHQIDRARLQHRQLVSEAEGLVASKANLDAQAAAVVARGLDRRASLASEARSVLAAQVDGRIAALHATPGTAVQPGQTLAVVIPAGADLSIDLWAPSRAAGFVRPGDRVTLMYDAFPFQKFGVGHGTVRHVGQAPLAPGELPFSPEQQEGLYRITVVPDAEVVTAYGRRWPLVPGMRLRADILLEKRSLLAWLLDPVLALRARERRGPA